MTVRIAAACLFAAAFAAGPLQAHHNIAMFDLSAPVWLEATVVRYEPRHPHVLITLHEKRPDGQVRTWLVEGPIMNRLERMHLARDFIKPGDVIGVCGFPFRKDIVAQQAGRPAGGTTLPALHGQLLVLPDGKRQPWGPYGKLDNCVRPGDAVQPWVEFIDGVPMAHEYWCKGVAMSSVAPRSVELVGQISARLSSPCR
jgi:hypothetical protein